MTKAIFLDRDGTINVDNHYVAAVENWEFSDRAPEALKLLQNAGYKLFVITNQGGISVGKYTQADMETLHVHMASELVGAGVKLDGIAFCPHVPDDNCTCRKPDIGMLEQLTEETADVDFSESWMIGDKEADVQFGKNAGLKTALIPSEYWQESALDVAPDQHVASLYAFAVSLTGTA